ncbi:septum formation initiator family protein [Robiginitalea sp. M366]|uniref:FtsB family cell division protein n=1 Tax=Robiginitalea aestuariiviva TaxID=3036903 RepID=UPI00240E7B82|nr:septum formation initiator family protein [Robiginitalea aestuariiviva]MDG1573259.1 septum formation initiator family protein [Robiginitalea aestuariiviva]
MFLKGLRKKKWFRIASNIYVLALTLFLVWMLFFDTNSLLIHRELQGEIRKLEKQMEFLEEQIARDQELIKTLEDPKALEKFAREKYYLKRPEEEIFIIEYPDSLKEKDHED